MSAQRCACHPRRRPTMLTILAHVVGAVLTAALAAAAPDPEQPSPHSRHTPIVDAIRMVQPCVVTIRKEVKGHYGQRNTVTGTGVIVDERGYVVTNSHVIREAAE